MVSLLFRGSLCLRKQKALEKPKEELLTCSKMRASGEYVSVSLASSKEALEDERFVAFKSRNWPAQVRTQLDTSKTLPSHPLGCTARSRCPSSLPERDRIPKGTPSPCSGVTKQWERAITISISTWLVI